MADAHDGFCDSCRQAPKDERDAKATRCGHEVKVADVAFCFPCALRFGACRRCGVLLPSLARKREPDP